MENLEGERRPFDGLKEIGELPEEEKRMIFDDWFHDRADAIFSQMRGLCRDVVAFKLNFSHATCQDAYMATMMAQAMGSVCETINYHCVKSAVPGESPDAAQERVDMIANDYIKGFTQALQEYAKSIAPPEVKEHFHSEAANDDILLADELEGSH